MNRQALEKLDCISKLILLKSQFLSAYNTHLLRNSTITAQRLNQLTNFRRCCLFTMLSIIIVDLCGQYKQNGKLRGEGDLLSVWYRFDSIQIATTNQWLVETVAHALNSAKRILIQLRVCKKRKKIVFCTKLSFKFYFYPRVCTNAICIYKNGRGRVYTRNFRWYACVSINVCCYFVWHGTGVQRAVRETIDTSYLDNLFQYISCALQQHQQWGPHLNE